MDKERMIEHKKLALLYILKILKEESDYSHPLKQDEILGILKKKYNIILERKAVARNIDLLLAAGYDIESQGKGKGVYLLTREFSDAELRLLIDGVLSSKYVSERHSKELINKLIGLSNKYFNSHVSYSKLVNQWNKTENQSVFYNIEVLGEAIELTHMVSYSYMKYDETKKLKKSSEQIVSPFQFILHNQRYYLMAYSETYGHMVYHRLDKISDIEILEDNATNIVDVEGFEEGIDYQRFSSSMPYMYSDEPETIEMVCDKKIIDHIIDWFGTEITISEIENDSDRVMVTLKASPMAMTYWALQYITYVEVVNPLSLRDNIQEILKLGVKKYFK